MLRKRQEIRHSHRRFANSTGAECSKCAVFKKRRKEMLFVLKFKFDPDHTQRVLEMWKHFTYPKEVKLIGRYLLIGRHISLAIFDAPSEESLLKVTAPFASLGIAYVTPAMSLEEAVRVQW
jgi:hypothetical protein